MYVAFNISVVEMSLVGFVLQDREYFHPRFLLHGVDKTQKLDLSNIGLGADFLSAELIIGVSDEIEGRTFFGLIHGSIDPEHATSVDRESEAFPQLRHHEHHVAIEIGLSKSNLETFADHMKHLRQLRSQLIPMYLRGPRSMRTSCSGSPNQCSVPKGNRIGEHDLIATSLGSSIPYLRA